MALPFGFLTRGAVGVWPSRPEVASAVGTWRQPLHARRAPRRPSSPPSNPRRAPGYGWIAKAIGISRASVDHVLQAARGPHWKDEETKAPACGRGFRAASSVGWMGGATDGPRIGSTE